MHADINKLDPIEAWKPARGLSWDLKWVAHLYRRAAFGAPPADMTGQHSSRDLMQSSLKRGREASVEELLSGTSNAERMDEFFDNLSIAINQFFFRVKRNDANNSKRIVLMTFSEFGRRVRENGSKGTDHGAASNMFVMGPAVNGGLKGKHPSLNPGDLDNGDLKFHTDFRRVYATILDQWLKCDSRKVLGQQFQHVDLFKKT
jgi:hypothetical protein